MADTGAQAPAPPAAPAPAATATPPTAPAPAATAPQASSPTTSVHAPPLPRPSGVGVPDDVAQSAMEAVRKAQAERDAAERAERDAKEAEDKADAARVMAEVEALAPGAVLTRFRDIVAKAHEMGEVVDPETEPYKTKYKARAMLTHFRDAVAKRFGLPALPQAQAAAVADDGSTEAGVGAASDAGASDDAEGGTEAQRDKSRMRSVVAQLNRYIGINCVVTEEYKEGVDTLKVAVDALYPRVVRGGGGGGGGSSSSGGGGDGAGKGDAAAAATPGSMSLEAAATLLAEAEAVLDSCNGLAMVYSGWDKHKQALGYLEQGTDAYNAATVALDHIDAHTRGDADADASGGAVAGAGTSSDSAAGASATTTTTAASAAGRETLEALYTHTTFYLAQVWGHLKNASLSAKYCRATLRRQLPSAVADGKRGGELTDRVEWAKNAMRLADYFLAQAEESPAARAEGAHCLASADAMLAVEEREQRKARRVLAERAKETEAAAAAARAAGDAGSGSAAAGAGVGAGGSAGAGDAAAASDKAASELPLDEDVLAARADWHLFCGKSYLQAMTTSRDRAMAKEMGLSSRDDAAGAGSGDGADDDGTDVFSTGPKVAAVRASDATPETGAAAAPPGGRDAWILDDKPFAALKLTPAAEAVNRVPVPAEVTDFESCRAAFKVALAHYTAALSFYVLDGFVTSHVQAQQDVSRLYKCLAFFEEDPKRATAMHQRRVALLAPLVEALNPAVYIMLHKELSLELGHCAADMVELRLMRIQAAGKVKKSDIKTVCEHADGAIGFFCHFIRCWKDERINDGSLPCGLGKMGAPIEGATSLDEGSVDAYLTAHFSIARMFGKRINPASKVADLRASLAQFRWIVANVPKLVPADAPATFRREASMAQEMVELLPPKIDHLHYRGVDLSLSTLLEGSM